MLLNILCIVLSGKERLSLLRVGLFVQEKQQGIEQRLAEEICNVTG